MIFSGVVRVFLFFILFCVLSGIKIYVASCWYYFGEVGCSCSGCVVAWELVGG